MPRERVFGLQKDAIRAAEHGGVAKDGFRIRSHEISRIEGLSDAVFGFAVTLLVVSLEVPKNFNELIEAMQGFFAFAISFVMLFQIWYFQYRYFRRYGLEDMTTVLLNASLLFVVLFYVYPLKFVFSVLVVMFGLAPKPEHGGFVVTDEQWPVLMLIYSAGFIAVFLIFFLLYAHALRKRRELGLSALEVHGTQTAMWSYAINMTVGLVSLALAVRTPTYAGMVYMSLGVFHPVYGIVMGRRGRQYRNNSLSAPPDKQIATETAQ